jgi:putative FmdB family regulatory protein
VEARADTQDLIAFYKGAGITVFGIIALSSQCFYEQEPSWVAKIIAEQTDGATWPICTTDEAALNASLKTMIVAIQGSASTTSLPWVPISSTLKLAVNGELLDRSEVGWRGRACHFRWLRFWRIGGERPRRGPCHRCPVLPGRKDCHQQDAESSWLEKEFAPFHGGLRFAMAYLTAYLRLEIEYRRNAFGSKRLLSMESQKPEEPMPLYEYHCPKCEDDFEEMIRMSQSDDPQPCPRCETESPRLLSATAGRSDGGGGRPMESRCAPSGG